MSDLIFYHYLGEFLAVFTITILTIITPGPDFVIVVRNSLAYSKRAGIFTSLGVASAVWIHIAYTLAGIGLILYKSIILFSVVKYLGAAYLIYLGVMSLKSKRHSSVAKYSKSKILISDGKAFKMGFINNALNPKATLFFLSLFTQVVSPGTPIVVQIFYGSLVSVSCVVWFSLVAVFLNKNGVKTVFQSFQFCLEKIMGAVLIGFGIKVAASSR